MNWLAPWSIACAVALVWLCVYAALAAGAKADEDLERWAEEHPEEAGDAA